MEWCLAWHYPHPLQPFPFEACSVASLKTGQCSPLRGILLTWSTQIKQIYHKKKKEKKRHGVRHSVSQSPIHACMLTFPQTIPVASIRGLGYKIFTRFKGFNEIQTYAKLNFCWINYTYSGDKIRTYMLNWFCWNFLPVKIKSGNNRTVLNLQRYKVTKCWN